MALFVLLTLAGVCGGVTANGRSSNTQTGTTETTRSMRIGVDVFAGDLDTSLALCCKALGVDFVSYHFFNHPDAQLARRLDGWAAEHGFSFLVNQEQSANSYEQRDPAIFRKPGRFFVPQREFVDICTSSPRFLGVCYDEAEHWTANGVFVTAGRRDFEPHFYDADGDTLQQAYEGNLHNLGILMRTCYGQFPADRRRTPIVGVENVFPVMQHVFARAGMSMVPKLLKETMVPVHVSVALGAARQYGVSYWTCCDLWFGGQYPGHDPEQLRSALLLSYWTGADGAYVENFDNVGDSPAQRTSDTMQLLPHGEVLRWFALEYVPSHPRTIRHQDFRPEIVIVRFPDTDWGQVPTPNWCTGRLYGAKNLWPDARTRYWFGIWNLLTHGVVPPKCLNWNRDPGIPYRFLIPANNVAVYDHLAADRGLYESARLVFLAGTQISPQCMATLERLVPEGLTVVTPSYLASARAGAKPGKDMTEQRDGRGSWIVADDVTTTRVRERLAPFLGSTGELRYVFGDTEVVFTAPDDPNRIGVRVRAESKDGVRRAATGQARRP